MSRPSEQESAAAGTGRRSLTDPGLFSLGLGLCLAGIFLNRWSLGWLLTESGNLRGLGVNLLLAGTQSVAFCLGCALLRGRGRVAELARRAGRAAPLAGGAALGLGIAGLLLCAAPFVGSGRLAAELELVEALFAGERALPQLAADLERLAADLEDGVLDDRSPAARAGEAELLAAVGSGGLADARWRWLAWQVVAGESARAELELSGGLPAPQGATTLAVRLAASWAASNAGSSGAWQLEALNVAGIKRSEAPAPLFEPRAELSLPVGTAIASLCTGDLDGDGRDDLYATTAAGANLAFLARTATILEERGRELGLDVAGPSRAAAVADFDNDGRVEVLVARDGAPALYFDAGEGLRFAPVEGRDLPRDVAAIAVGDVDGDGWLDAYFATGMPQGPSELDWQERGPVSAGGPDDVLLFGSASGWSRRAGASRPARRGHALQAAFSDWDGDRDLDLCLVDDLAAVRFLSNNGCAAFDSAPVAFAPDLGPAVTGVGLGDHDGDGRPDLFATRPPRAGLARVLELVDGVAASSTLLCWNAGTGYTRVLGPEAEAFARAGGRRCDPFVDLDADGRLDLVLYGVERAERGHAWWRRARLGPRGQALASPRARAAYMALDHEAPPRPAEPGAGFELFLNRDCGGPRFEELTGLAALPHGATAVAWVDADRDGLVDLIAASRSAGGERLTLYGNRCRCAPDVRALAVVLVGGAGGAAQKTGWSARDGHGARIEVHVQGRVLVRVHRAAELAGASAGGATLFGLGGAGAAERVVVRWPSGRTQTALDVPAGTELWFYEDASRSPTGTPDVPRPYRPPAAREGARSAFELHGSGLPATIEPSPAARRSPRAGSGVGDTE